MIPFDLGGIVNAVFQNVMELMPYRIVKFYQHGVRSTWGKAPKVLKPGLRWCFWLMHDIVVVPSTEEVIDLPTQTIITKDRKTLCFSVNIGRVITDPVLWMSGVHDFDASSRALAMIHLSKRVGAMTLDEFIQGREALEKSLRGTLETLWKPWGTECTHVGFTDFSETTQVVRFLQDQNAMFPRTV